MNIEVFALCDAATESGGKLNLLGAFDSIMAPTLPLLHPSCAVVLRLRFKRIETGRHHIRVNLVNNDGKALTPSFDSDIQVAMAEGEEATVVNLILNFQQLRLEAYGRYSIDLAVDGRQESSLPLYIKKLPQGVRESS